MSRVRGPLLCLSLLSCSLAARAQARPASPAGADWSRVQRVAVGTEIRLTAHRPIGSNRGFGKLSSRVDCLFVSASNDDIACTHTDKILFFPIHRNFRVARPDVASVRLTRRDLSAFVGGAIGTGTGVGVTGIVVATSSETDHSEDAIVYILLASLGAGIGAGIGRTTDFMGGPTIYRAP